MDCCKSFQTKTLLVNNIISNTVKKMLACCTEKQNDTHSDMRLDKAVQNLTERVWSIAK